ncbi:MAG TPA: CPBP family intramembrane glutamic endopeptidase [Thermoanaerobaculia bacterium]|jgi:membrane protease YdiL (CAAX protease family)|nr:CPBP family intramembrane glutamic endopeptidase [Thermoanaerobaculia bacterium]
MTSLTGPLAAVLGLAAAFALDRLCAARGLLPPGFREPWRRVVAGLIVAVFLGAAVFLPLAAAMTGAVVEPPNLSKIDNFQLFELHVIMIAVMALWLLLGFAGRPEPERAAAAVPVPPAPQTPGWEGIPVDAGLPPPESPPPLPPASPPVVVPLGRQLLAQLGFLAPDVPREIGIGLTLGLGAWLAVLAALVAIAGVLIAVGAKDMVPQQPPALVPLIAALPFGVRLAVSLSAGIVEETFFRGFLQPRVGIVLSTAFFALAHLSYQQPFMLVGITLLSLIYAFLVRWRQSIWAAIAAHALFDGVQLLVVVPMVLKLVHGTAAGKAVAFLGFLG